MHGIPERARHVRHPPGAAANVSLSLTNCAPPIHPLPPAGPRKGRCRDPQVGAVPVGGGRPGHHREARLPHDHQGICSSRGTHKHSHAPILSPLSLFSFSATPLPPPRSCECKSVTTGMATAAHANTKVIRQKSAGGELQRWVCVVVCPTQLMHLSPRAADQRRGLAGCLQGVQ
jgi:hypothetical protein